MVFADKIYLDEKPLNMKEFTIDFYSDKSKKDTIDTVRNKNFIAISSKKAMHCEKSLWFKLKFENSTFESKEVFISYRHIHLIRYLSFFTIKNEKLTNSLHYNNHNNIAIDNRIGNSVYFKVLMKPKEVKEVYINVITKAPLYFDIRVSDFYNYVNNLIYTNIFIIFLIGLLISQGVYYLFLYITTPYKEYVYFSMFVFSMSIWSIFIYGGLGHYFNMYGEDTYYLNSLVFITPVFTMLLFKAIFLKDNKQKRIKSLINFIIILLVVIAIYNLFTSKDMLTLIPVMKYAPYVYMGQQYLFLCIIVFMFLKKVPLVGYFLLGFSINVFTSTISALFFLGIIEYTDFALYANGIGTFIESIVFSILLSYRIKLLFRVSEENRHQLVLKANKLKAMNEVIENISHQWRQPLTNINATVMLLDEQMYKKNIKNNYMEEKLNEIENITEYMSKTIDVFKNFHSKEKKLKYFNLKEMINECLSIVNSTLSYSKIVLLTNLDGSLYLNSYESELQQVILVIINNAKDALLSKKIENSKINIDLYNMGDLITIKISDNAGGINKEIQDEIFNPYFTTKHKSQGAGLGLYISKIIIENELNGEFYFKNEDAGVSFYIELNKKEFL